MFGTGKLRAWRFVVAITVGTSSLQTADAQSTLRFVDASEQPLAVAQKSSISAPQSVIQPRLAEGQTELRFLEQNVTSAPSGLPKTGAKSFQPVRIASSIINHIPTQTAAQPTQTPTRTDAWELRFVAEPGKLLMPAPQQLVDQPAEPIRMSTDSFVHAGTELFAVAPHTTPKEFKPQAAAALKPAQAPQPNGKLADTRPATRPQRTTPTYAPAGTELFVSTPPTHLQFPAVDITSQLTKTQQPQPTAAAVKPAEQAGSSVRALSPVATDLFAATSETRPQPHQQLVTAPPKVLAAVEQTPVTTPIVAAPTPITPVAAPTSLAAVPIPVQTAPQPANAIAKSPEPTRVAQSTSVLPGKELFSSPQPRVANLEVLPYEYDSKNLKIESQYAGSNNAPVFTMPTTPSLAGSQILASTDSPQPEVYEFRFAGASGNSPSSLSPPAKLVSVETVSGETPAALPGIESAPCGGNAAPYGQFGCPYGPGQSGAHTVCGVDCGNCGAPCCSTWSDAQCIPWSLFGPGEYVGPARQEHVSTYYLRVNDFVTLTFIESRRKSAEHYRIGVGDRLQIEWLQGAGNTEASLNRELLVQPDGTVTLPLIGDVTAAGKTIHEFRDEVVELFGKYQRDPQITVTPVLVNVAIQDLLKAVTSKSSSSGQTQDLRVTPEGTIQAAGIGSVYVQGLTLEELRTELEARYAAAYGPGLAVSPALTERATSYVFLGGEVRTPGRYTLEGPTTVMQAISMAGGWNNGGDIGQVVVFRRDENWCLKAIKIDVWSPLYGDDPCPTNDVWLRENDLVIVPKTNILCATDVIELYFTRGVYAVFPISYVYDFSQSSGITPIP